jgi:hypothetical protein
MVVSKKKNLVEIACRTVGAYGASGTSPVLKSGYFQILQNYQFGYPEKTDVCCWWCCHSFNTRPLGMPRLFDPQKNTFSVIGCFCSFNCILAYNATDKFVRCTPADITSMHRIVTGDDSVTLTTNKLKKAPDRSVLRMFGGNLSIDEFRSSFCGNVSVSVNIAPLIPLPMYCEIRMGKENTTAKETRLEIKKGKSRSTLDQMISFS